MSNELSDPTNWCVSSELSRSCGLARRIHSLFSQVRQDFCTPDEHPSCCKMRTRDRRRSQMDHGYKVDPDRQCEAKIKNTYLRCKKPAIVDRHFCAYHSGLAGPRFDPFRE